MNKQQEFKEQRLAAIKEDINCLPNPKFNTTAIIHSLIQDFQRVGLGHLVCENDIAKAKQCFYKAGRVGMIEFQTAQNKLPVPGKLQLQYYTNGLGAWPAVLLSDSPQLWKDFAENLIVDFAQGGEKWLGNQISLGIKYYLLNELGKAEEWIEKAIRNKRKAQELSGHTSIILGLIRQDSSLINEGISRQLSWYKHTVYNKQLVYYNINSAATAFTLLAIRRGLAVNTSDPFIYNGLIEDTTPVAFEEIEDVYDALRKAIRPSLLSKLYQMIR